MVEMLAVCGGGRLARAADASGVPRGRLASAASYETAVETTIWQTPMKTKKQKTKTKQTRLCGRLHTNIDTLRAGRGRRERRREREEAGRGKEGGRERGKEGGGVGTSIWPKSYRFKPFWLFASRGEGDR